jgi:hypothetical protein
MIDQTSHSADKERPLGAVERHADSGKLVQRIAAGLPRHQTGNVPTSLSSCLLQQQHDLASAEYSMSACPGSDTMAALLPTAAGADIAARMLAEIGSTGCWV